MPKAVKTPECDKIVSAQPQSRTISNFLEWLDEQDWEIAQRLEDRPHRGQLAPITEGRERMLARFFEIDLDKAENERQALLASLR